MTTSKMNNCTFYYFSFQGYYFYPDYFCCNESSPKTYVTLNRQSKTFKACILATECMPFLFTQRNKGRTREAG